MSPAQLLKGDTRIKSGYDGTRVFIEARNRADPTITPQKTPVISCSPDTSFKSALQMQEIRSETLI
jgi:hypothetical protein